MWKSQSTFFTMSTRSQISFALEKRILLRLHCESFWFLNYCTQKDAKTINEYKKGDRKTKENEKPLKMNGSDIMTSKSWDLLGTCLLSSLSVNL